jgi:hypothetical protein
VVTERGILFLMSQNVARPRFTSCFIRRMRASLNKRRVLKIVQTGFYYFSSIRSNRLLALFSENQMLFNAKFGLNY